MIFEKVTLLSNKAKKERKSNKLFQDMMLKELANINQAIVDKKKRRVEKTNGNTKPTRQEEKKVVKVNHVPEQQEQPV